jgi:hypothetical protein
MSNIQKPVSVAIEETQQKLAETINDSNLHIALLEMIVKELYLEIRKNAEIVSANEKAEYDRMCSEANENENSN